MLLGFILGFCVGFMVVMYAARYFKRRAEMARIMHGIEQASRGEGTYCGEDYFMVHEGSTAPPDKGR